MRTGSRRPYVAPVTVSQPENEYLTRKAYSLKMSKAAYMRSAALPIEWEAELETLRAMQPGLPVSAYTKQPHVRNKAA